MKPLIINTPSLQSIRERNSGRIISTVMWTLWFYLWIPLITFLLWYFGGARFYEVMIVENGYLDVLDITKFFTILTLTEIIIITLWIYYNIRQSKKPRRQPPLPPCNNRQLAAYFKIELEQVDELQSRKTVSVNFDEHTAITGFGPIQSTTPAKPNLTS